MPKGQATLLFRGVARPVVRKSSNRPMEPGPLAQHPVRSDFAAKMTKTTKMINKWDNDTNEAWGCGHCGVHGTTSSPLVLERYGRNHWGLGSMSAREATPCHCLQAFRLSGFSGFCFCGVCSSQAVVSVICPSVDIDSLCVACQWYRDVS
jgi:hypothetical protein